METRTVQRKNNGERLEDNKAIYSQNSLATGSDVDACVSMVVRKAEYVRCRIVNKYKEMLMSKHREDCSNDPDNHW